MTGRKSPMIATAADPIYESWRREILSGVLAPGMPLCHNKIAIDLSSTEFQCAKHYADWRSIN